MANHVQFDDFIEISVEDVENLKRKCEACEPGGTFFFKDREFLKEYAEYMIQHLETKYGEL